jgi:hypothetical protein
VLIKKCRVKNVKMNKTYSLVSVMILNLVLIVLLMIQITAIFFIVDYYIDR